MTKTVTITIPVEVREIKADDVRLKVWIGTAWKHLDWRPFSPALAAITKTKPHSYRVKLEFPPVGVLPVDQLRYRKGLFIALRKAGVIG